MTQPPRSRPGARPADKGHAPERLLALAGVIGLLAVAVVSVSLVLDAVHRDSGSATAEATVSPTRTPKPTPTPKPKPTPVPLTTSQRAERTAAADIVASRGFEVVRLGDYDPRKTLRVLIGRGTTSRAKLAFFFVNGDYIGNDANEPSASLRVAKQGDLQVTLAYRLFSPGDQPLKPTGERLKVRFRWDGAALAPLDAIPDPSERTPGRQVQ